MDCVVCSPVQRRTPERAGEMKHGHAGPNSGTDLGGRGAFSVTTELRNTVLLVAVEGRIDGKTVAWLEHAVRVALHGDACFVVMDLAKVRIILSAGLKLLLSLGELASRRGGSLAIVVPKSPVREVLAVSGFDRIFPIFDDPAEAVAAIPGDAKRDEPSRTRRNARRADRRSPRASGFPPQEALALSQPRRPLPTRWWRSPRAPTHGTRRNAGSSPDPDQCCRSYER